MEIDAYVRYTVCGEPSKPLCFTCAVQRANLHFNIDQEVTTDGGECDFRSTTCSICKRSLT